MINEAIARLGPAALGKRPGQVLLLAYHNVTAPEGANSWMSLDHRLFEKHLRWLRRFTHLLDPHDLLAGRPLKRDSMNVMLTFDDGFVGWHDYVLPLLVKYRIPALFFVSTEPLLSGRSFWFEEVVHTLHQASITQADLRSLGLPRYALPSVGIAARWPHVSQMLEDIKRHASGDEHRFARKVVDVLLKHHDTRKVPPVVNQPLAAEQMQAMHRSGLCVFGSHAHHHRILAGLSGEELTQEMTRSRQILEDLLQEPVETIAYPNGLADDAVVAAASDAGYRFGFLSEGGVLTGEAPVYCLPRFMIGGFDGPMRLMALIARESWRGRQRR